MSAPGKGTQNANKTVLVHHVQKLFVRGQGAEGVVSNLAIFIGLASLHQGDILLSRDMVDFEKEFPALTANRGLLGLGVLDRLVVNRREGRKKERKNRERFSFLVRF